MFIICVNFINIHLCEENMYWIFLVSVYQSVKMKNGKLTLFFPTIHLTNKHIWCNSKICYHLNKSQLLDSLLIYFSWCHLLLSSNLLVRFLVLLPCWLFKSFLYHTVACIWHFSLECWLPDHLRKQVLLKIRICGLFKSSDFLCQLNDCHCSVRTFCCEWANILCYSSPYLLWCGVVLFLLVFFFLL